MVVQTTVLESSDVPQGDMAETRMITDSAADLVNNYRTRQMVMMFALLDAPFGATVQTMMLTVVLASALAGDDSEKLRMMMAQPCVPLLASMEVMTKTMTHILQAHSVRNLPMPMIFAQPDVPQPLVAMVTMTQTCPPLNSSYSLQMVMILAQSAVARLVVHMKRMLIVKIQDIVNNLKMS